MRQRLGAVGGTLTLQSAPGEGTHVRAFVPGDRSKPRP
jgi:signal transduction histidine kinase